MYELNLKIRSSPITDTMSSSIELSGTISKFPLPVLHRFWCTTEATFYVPLFTSFLFSNSVHQLFLSRTIQRWRPPLFFESLITSWNFKLMISDRSFTPRTKISISLSLNRGFFSLSSMIAALSFCVMTSQFLLSR